MWTKAKKHILMFSAIMIVVLAYVSGIIACKKNVWPLGRGYFTPVHYSLDGKRNISDGMKWPGVEAYEFLAAEDIFSISSAENALSVRKKVISTIWGWQENIIEGSSSILRSYSRLSDIDAREMDHLSILSQKFDVDVVLLGVAANMSPIGLDYEAYLLRRHSEPRCLLVYNDGHHDGIVNGAVDGSGDLIQAVLGLGCDVLIVPMPTLGFNQEIVRIETQVGPLVFKSNHGPFAFAKPEQGSALQYFLEPIRRSLNWALSEYKYSVIAMAGLSGGGWSTTLYSAVDARVDLSFSIAGSLPLPMRAVDYRHWGDYEQNDKDFYSMVSYGDLYLLGAIDKSRQSILAFNYFDSCCFGGGAGEVLRQLLVQHEKGSNLDIPVHVFIEHEQVGHVISEYAAGMFLSALQSRLQL